MHMSENLIPPHGLLADLRKRLEKTAEINPGAAKSAYMIGGRDEASFYSSNKKSDFDATIASGKSATT